MDSPCGEDYGRCRYRELIGEGIVICKKNLIEYLDGAQCTHPEYQKESEEFVRRDEARRNRSPAYFRPVMDSIKLTEMKP